MEDWQRQFMYNAGRQYGRRDASNRFPYSYIEAEQNDEGVYVITTAKEARQWRTNVQPHPETFKRATERFFRSQ